MKTTIAGLSNERLESEIASIYWTAAKEQPPITVPENGLLGLFWEEFDKRFAEGTVDRETDWTEKRWDD